MPSTRRGFLRTLTGTVTVLTGCQSDSGSATVGQPKSGTSTATATLTTSVTRTAPAGEPDPDAIGGDPASLPETPWPLPDRDPSNGGYLPDGPDFDRAPNVGWELAPLTPDEDRYDPWILDPIIAGDTVYVVNALTYGTNVVRPDSHYLRAISTVGTERWRVLLSTGDGTPAPSLPAIYGDVVLLGLDRTLRAYERSTGDVAWTVDIGEGIHGIVPTPDRILVRAGRSIVAIDTGDKLWTVPYEVYPSALAVGSDTVFVGSGERLSALDPASGAVRWREDLPAVPDGGVSSLVAVPGGVLARQHGGHVHAYTDAGAEVWRHDGLHSSLATDGSLVYAGAPGSVRALRVTNGRVLWERACDGISNCTGVTDVPDVVVTDGSVVAALEDGPLVCFDARTGRVRWTTQAPAVEALALAENGIYGAGDVGDPMIQFTA